MSAPRPSSVFPKILLVLLVVLPWSYTCMILAVIIHEIVGHGLVSLCLGGEFVGFSIMTDGMGWAMTSGGQNPQVGLAGGVFMTSLAGTVALIASFNKRFSPLLRILFSVLALMLLLEGVPYTFWNSLFPRPPGDIGKILMSTNPNSALRWTLCTVSGAALVASVGFGSLALWRSLEQLLGSMDSRRAAVIMLLAITVPGVAYNFVFDWNQLIDDVGHIPSVTHAVMHVLAAVFLYRVRSRNIAPAAVPKATWAVCICASWAVCAGLFGAVMLWMRHGVLI